MSQFFGWAAVIFLFFAALWGVALVWWHALLKDWLGLDYTLDKRIEGVLWSVFASCFVVFFLCIVVAMASAPPPVP